MKFSLFCNHSLHRPTVGMARPSLLLPPRIRRRMFQHPNLFDARWRIQKKVHRGILNFQIHTSESQERDCTFIKRPSTSHSFPFLFISQSVAAALSFVYSTHLGLRVQMAILVVTGTIGTIAFYTVEWRERRKQMMKNEMIKSSDSNIVPS